MVLGGQEKILKKNKKTKQKHPNCYKDIGKVYFFGYLGIYSCSILKYECLSAWEFIFFLIKREI